MVQPKPLSLSITRRAKGLTEGAALSPWVQRQTQEKEEGKKTRKGQDKNMKKGEGRRVYANKVKGERKGRGRRA